MVCPPPDTCELEQLFRYEVFKLLKSEGKISDAVIENMMNWRHGGFKIRGTFYSPRVKYFFNPVISKSYDLR